MLQRRGCWDMFLKMTTMQAGKWLDCTASNPDLREID